MTILPSILRGLPLFAGIADPEKDALLAQGRLRSFPRGQMLFAQGDKADRFFLVASGVVQLFRTTPEGHAKTIDLLHAGQMIGEGEIMDSCRHYRTNASAAEDVSVLEFPARWLKDTAQAHTPFALNLLGAMSERAHMAEVEAEHQASMSAAQLVACFLQRLCVLTDGDPKRFSLPYSKTLIASRLGMELETFSRTLTKLREHGIQVSGSDVSIADFARIEAYVCGSCSIAEDCHTRDAMAHKTCAKHSKPA